MKLIFILIPLISIVLSAEDNGKNTIITIKQGVLRGTERLNRENGTFYAFRSIPYGEPPVGPLRFMPPIPHKGWTGTYDATQDLPWCYQTKISDGSQSGTEDCLRVNVFTRKVKPSKLAPVMFFIHGGGFIQGDASETFYNPNFMMTENVVLVTVAYRLGILGFCSLGIGTNNPLTANAGLKDQNLALKWVRENIEAFGGDPHKITIFGESAGAVSATLHLFSPLSSGLFQKVIAQSASIFSGWALGKPGSCEAIAKYLQMKSSDSTEILGQLQSINVSDLLAAQAPAFGIIRVNELNYYAPVIEGNLTGSFLPMDPRLQLKYGNFMRVPMIVGYNDKEGILLDVFNVKYKKFGNFYDIAPLIPHDLNDGSDQRKLQNVVNEIKEFYFNGSVPAIQDKSVNMTNLITDSVYAHAILRTAKLFAKHTDVYFYRFSLDTGVNYIKKLSAATSTYKGASHIDELGYLFETIHTPPIVHGSIEETKIYEMVKIWTNFAGWTKSIYSGWTAMAQNLDNLNYLDISNDFMKNSINPDCERMDFWNNLYKKYGKETE